MPYLSAIQAKKAARPHTVPRMRVSSANAGNSPGERFTPSGDSGNGGLLRRYLSYD